jgi:hypothetical protein
MRPGRLQLPRLVFSLSSPEFGAIRDRFLTESRFARFNYLLEGARLKFAQLEGRVIQVAAELDQVKQGLASKEFREAAATAAEEAVRAVSVEKIDQFSSILVGSVDPALGSDSPADAASLIRDIARLAPTDLKVLGHLERSYSRPFYGKNPGLEGCNS